MKNLTAQQLIGWDNLMKWINRRVFSVSVIDESTVSHERS